MVEAGNKSAAHPKRFTAAFTRAAIGMAIVRHDGRLHQVHRAPGAPPGRSEADLPMHPFNELPHPAAMHRRSGARARVGAAVAVAR